MIDSRNHSEIAEIIRTRIAWHYHQYLHDCERTFCPEAHRLWVNYEMAIHQITPYTFQ